MIRVPLAETLAALAESLQPPPGSGLALAEARLDVPLEGVLEPGAGGAPPTFFACVPHSRWATGFLPAVHVAHVELAGDDGDR